MTRVRSSLYPPRHPVGCKILVQTPPNALTSVDRILVALSSMFVVGSFLWVPVVYAYAWKRWRTIPKTDTKRRAMYAALLISMVGVAVVGPHRTERVGIHWLRVRKWRLWSAWLNFLAFEVVAEQNVGCNKHDSSSTTTDDTIHSNGNRFDSRNDQAILTVIPHGIFPFPLAFAAMPEIARSAFGEFRPVVASATKLFPLVRTFLGWLRAVIRNAFSRLLTTISCVYLDFLSVATPTMHQKRDASRFAVDRALSEGSRIGLAPGGIAEMFEGYPKPMTHIDDEYVNLKSRKGFIKLAIQHGIPVIPIYCFGGSKMMKRLQLPAIVERISNLLRIGICIFFGSWGLPIPFRQRLLYVMGQPIFPPPHIGTETSELFHKRVDTMHERFCDELRTLFDRHKESYGWERKTLRLV